MIEEIVKIFICVSGSAFIAMVVDMANQIINYFYPIKATDEGPHLYITKEIFSD